MWEQRLPPGVQRWLFRFSIERGFLDSLLERFVARPFVWFFRRLDAFDRAVSRWIDGEPGLPPGRRDLP
jgi:hypothetical protein